MGAEHHDAPTGPFLVLGCGAAGMSAARALATLTAPADVAVWDAHDGTVTHVRREQLASQGIRVQLGPWHDDLLERPRARTVIKSPGVASSSAPVVGALARGIPVIDELELARRQIRRPLVAVTGTDGKSTTCALLARAMGAPGEPLEVAGNTQFGPPLSAVARDGGPVIVETSSYQLEVSSPAFADLAVLTSLTPEHLFRHATMERYARAKRRAVSRRRTRGEARGGQRRRRDRPAPGEGPGRGGKRGPHGGRVLTGRPSAARGRLGTGARVAARPLRRADARARAPAAGAPQRGQRARRARGVRSAGARAHTCADRAGRGARRAGSMGGHRRRDTAARRRGLRPQRRGDPQRIAHRAARRRRASGRPRPCCPRLGGRRRRGRLRAAGRAPRARARPLRRSRRGDRGQQPRHPA